MVLKNKIKLSCAAQNRRARGRETRNLFCPALGFRVYFYKNTLIFSEPEIFLNLRPVLGDFPLPLPPNMCLNGFSRCVLSLDIFCFCEIRIFPRFLENSMSNLSLDILIKKIPIKKKVCTITGTPYARVDQVPLSR